MPQRLVVIGGVAAGMSAAAKAKRENRELEVVVYEQGAYISYAACGMPYWLAGEIADHRELIVRTPQQMAKQGVQVHILHQVTEIDAGQRLVTVRNHQSRKDLTTGYDNLVIATGAHAAHPELPGSRLAGVLALRSLESGLVLRRFLEEQCPHRAVILGGGYIGVEMAETLRRLGVKVTMLIRSGRVLRSALDDDMRELLQAELERHGVLVRQGEALAFEGANRVEAVVAQDRSYPCDLVVLGIGARPNVGLAHAAGVALGRTGAIAVDSQMKTNLPGIYAAGDCVEVHHRVTGQPDYIPLGSTANKQGRVAGTNAAGGQATFAGVVGTMVVRAIELGVASTGLTAGRAQDLGYSFAETRITAKDLAHYFPGAADMTVKLVTESPTGRLLGGQIIGRPAAAKHIDVLATALHQRLTVDQLQQLDLAYAPPFAPVWDPILVAAGQAVR